MAHIWRPQMGLPFDCGPLKRKRTRSVWLHTEVQGAHKLLKNWLDTATMKSEPELVIPQAPRPGWKKVTSPTLDCRGIIATGAVLERVMKSERMARIVYLNILDDV